MSDQPEQAVKQTENPPNDQKSPLDTKKAPEIGLAARITGLLEAEETDRGGKYAPGISDRMSGLMEVLMEQSDFLGPLSGTINKMITNFMKDANDESLSVFLGDMLTTMIPYLLFGGEDEDTN